MKITGYELYALPFAFVSGGYTTAYGTRSRLENLLLTLDTDEGMVGLGEICRKAGNSPEPTATWFVERCHAALHRIVGCDPLDLEASRARLGALDAEFSNLACAFETACYDLAAKVENRPLWALLGGRVQDSVPVYHTIGQGPPQAMAAEARSAQQGGCRVVQIKVGSAADEDHARIDALLGVLRVDAVLLADANGGWKVESALAVIAAFDDARILWEEPCKTYAENRRVAAKSGAAVVLDQCVSGPQVVRQACRDGEVRGLGIKCTMQGGLRAGRRSRDLAVEGGLQLKVDDSWSADVATSASLHLAMAVPPGQLIASVDMRPYFDGRISREGPVCESYRFTPGALPGLGLVAQLEHLDKPLR